jgi:hypothetical protein
MIRGHWIAIETKINTLTIAQLPSILIQAWRLTGIHQ